MTRDIERLRALQNDDGGFGFWRRGERSWPYVSIHVAHALARAKAKGFAGARSKRSSARGATCARSSRNIPKDYGRRREMRTLERVRARTCGA